MVMTGRSSRRATYVVSGLARFFEDQGICDPPLVAPVIEAYCSAGLSHRCSSTRGTYRSVLRQLSGAPRPVVATSFVGSRAAPPYRGQDRAELYAIARAQPICWRARSALVLICLSMGAGLRAGEVARARHSDVVISGKAVSIHVGGEHPRVVPVLGEEALVLGRLVGGTGGDHLFHPGEADRGYANFVNDFCRSLKRDPAAPKLTVSRLRSSFVCDHLSAGTSLSVLLELTGIIEVESLIYYSRLVRSAPQSKAALRAALARR
jgi:integrase